MARQDLCLSTKDEIRQILELSSRTLSQKLGIGEHTAFYIQEVLEEQPAIARHLRTIEEMRRVKKKPSDEPLR